MGDSTRQTMSARPPVHGYATEGTRCHSRAFISGR